MWGSEPEPFEARGCTNRAKQVRKCSAITKGSAVRIYVLSEQRYLNGTFGNDCRNLVKHFAWKAVTIAAYSLSGISANSSLPISQ